MKNFKYILMSILLILIIVFSVLLVNAKKNTTSKIDSSLSEKEIYDEILTEVINGEEKYTVHDESGNRVNISSKIQETQPIKGINGLEVEGINITAKNNNTQIIGKIKNNGISTLGGSIVKISLKNDEEIEILAVGVYVNEVAPGEETNIQTSVSTDLANAYSYEVSK